MTSKGTLLMRMIWPTGSPYGAEQVRRPPSCRAPPPWRRSLERRARLNIAPRVGVPVADGEVVGRGARARCVFQFCPSPATCARVCSERRRAARPSATSLLDRAQVVPGQRRLRAGAAAHAADGLEPERDDEHVRAHRLEGLRDPRLRALADRHHRDDRADADDDAERGQERAQSCCAGARGARPQDDLQRVHGAFSIGGAAAPARGTCRRSETIAPSRTSMTRAA